MHHDDKPAGEAGNLLSQGRAFAEAMRAGVEPPSPSIYHSEVNKDRTAREDRPGRTPDDDAIAAAMHDALTHGVGVVRVTAEGAEHVPATDLRPNRCYGCNRVEAPAGHVGSYYCGGCAEWDAYTSDPGDDAGEEE